MDYGVPRGERHFRAFDISVDGRYLNAWPLAEACHEHSVDIVPGIVVEEPFSQSQVAILTSGETYLIGLDDDASIIKSKFKGREGIVITPMIEQHSDVLGGRMILKSVSADYLDRKNAQDNGELEAA
jgi:hypothetical protein